MSRDKLITIKCPHCGTEYLPEEIYVPTGFFGHPVDIERSYDGKIESFLGKSLDTKESYRCDSCGNTFNIDAQIKFTTTADPVKDLSKDYVTKIYINRISLFEDQQ